MIRDISRLPRSIVTVAFLLSLCGCIPEFREPLSNGETSEVDEQALGTWYMIDEPNSGPPMTIVKVAGTNAIEVQFPKEEGKDAPEKPVRIFTTKIGEKRFFSISCNSILPKDEQKQPETFFVFAYKIEGKTLQLFMLNADVFGDAVAAGKLEGTAKRPQGLFRWLGPKYGSVTITGSPKKLREFLAANKSELVDPEPVMRCTREPPRKNKQ
ncbi:MAG: hypothetical protein ABSG53_30235 [Thermoguttaceae bacterium]|jgi:hypothetical protein